MKVAGISIDSHENKTLCKVEDFSDEIKKIIRDELAGILHGKEAVADLPDYHSYKNTLKVFLDRYRDKAEETQKGMIGELLAHILISRFHEDLRSISILKNKEDRGIKKGFDIVYCSIANNSIWYSEVKSGHKSADDCAAKANRTLLDRSYSSLKEMFLSERDSLWQSAIIDVGLVLNGVDAPTIKRLLSQDSPLVNTPTAKSYNGIFVSVLYEDVSNSFTLSDMHDFLDKIKKENKFEGILIFSIQKGTFEKISNFLEAEIQNV
jgi:hypothetical protein